jgi:hypothetical protein
MNKFERVMRLIFLVLILIPMTLFIFSNIGPYFDWIRSLP